MLTRASMAAPFGTVCGVIHLVSEADLCPRQRKLLAIGVEPQRHRSSWKGVRDIGAQIQLRKHPTWI